MTNPQKKKLIYRAMHRGFKEADIVLGSFAKKNIEGMNQAELDEFEKLLNVVDKDLYAWIIKEVETPSEYKGPLMDKIQAHVLSDVEKIISPEGKL